MKPKYQHIAIIIAVFTLMLAFRSPAQNLLGNGSFETGDFTNWTASGNIVVSSGEGAYDGLQAVVFNSGDVAPNGVLSQSFATTPGFQYLLEFSYGNYGAGTPQQLDIQVIGNSSLFSTTVTSPAANIPVDFGQFSFNFTADSSLTLIQFTDDPANQTLNEDGVLDYVRITTVPEPNAALLTGFGSLLILAFSRRRR